MLKSLLSPAQALAWLGQETEVTSTPITPVDNVVIATKGLQDRNINIIAGTTVENQGKLILTWEDHVRMDLKEISLSTMNCIDSDQDTGFNKHGVSYRRKIPALVWLCGSNNR